MRALALLCVVAACSSNGKTDKTPGPDPRPETPPEVKPEPTATAPAIPERVGCAADGDCMNSCSQGAVSKTWWQEAFPGDESCEDGCADKEAGAPRCQAGRCVAFDRGGQERAECTDRDDQPIEKIGPAHRCSSDADCSITCSLGAVNKAWLATRSDFADCRGGCTAVGVQSPRCESGLCVAYRKTRADRFRDDGCTQLSVWQ